MLDRRARRLLDLPPRLLRRGLIGREFSAPPVESIVNASKQRLRLERLVQEADGSEAQHPSTDFFVWIGCNEDRRNTQTQVGKALLQLNAVDIRHLNIGNQTRRFRPQRRLEERVRRGKRAGQKPVGLHKGLDCPPDNTVIIYDRD